MAEITQGQRTWTSVGKRFNRGEVQREIETLTWHTFPRAITAPMSQGLAITTAIREYCIPKVSAVAWGGLIQNHYDLIGIEGNYRNGRVRVYVVDTGGELVLVMSEFFGQAEGGGLNDG